eukprot:TRINITY_DN2058_c0_g2_i2.p1 TRINITY_DN2058_c0_g2~~TRINITY_DN2058_c0_g2_i2.p1  ORF type:complete len:295 (-),score=56.09 TRINITY_DN2058_c0_g2_i2:226-1110(-)
MAPEVIKQTGHGRAADIWSLGCTIVEMATGKPPFSEHSNMITAMYLIGNGKAIPAIPKNLSPEGADFLRGCFRINPRERPNVYKCLRHPFVVSAQALVSPLLRTPNTARATNSARRGQAETRSNIGERISDNLSTKAETRSAYEIPRPSELEVASTPRRPGHLKGEAHSAMLKEKSWLKPAKIPSYVGISDPEVEDLMPAEKIPIPASRPKSKSKPEGTQIGGRMQSMDEVNLKRGSSKKKSNFYDKIFQFADADRFEQDQAGIIMLSENIKPDNELQLLNESPDTNFQAHRLL